MNEAELVNLLRNNTHLGRLAASEVREALEYMQSIGVVFPTWGSPIIEQALVSEPMPPAIVAASPEDDAK